MVRIQPTYEELKHVGAGGAGGEGSGIQPTYEELKQHLPGGLRRGVAEYPAYL